ncbi:MAG: VWA domain-containing protein [Chloroflexi bacterium]|nr:VWA domain-containing protein [Chloroflexota bacterium]
MQTNPLRFIWTSILIGFLTVFPTLKVSAQDALQIRITQVDNSNFPNVTVYVSVTDSVGEPVGVDPTAIQIYENGELMQPADIRGGGEGGDGQADPLTTMLVIDISGSMDKNGKLDAAKEAAKTYVTQMRAGDQAGLITFDTQTYYVQPVTTDTTALLDAIDSLVTGGDTSMFDALIEAEKALETISGRKAIIVLADGMDNHSTATADDVINQIGPSGLTISTIGFGDAGATSQEGLDEPALKSLAERSGGLYSFAADAQALTALYERYGPHAAKRICHHLCFSVHAARRHQPQPDRFPLDGRRFHRDKLQPRRGPAGSSAKFMDAVRHDPRRATPFAADAHRCLTRTRPASRRIQGRVQAQGKDQTGAARRRRQEAEHQGQVEIARRRIA